MDHDILIAELEILNGMSQADRKALAKIRRQQQIENFREFDATSPRILRRTYKPKPKIHLYFPLHHAIKDQVYAEVEKLLKNGENPNCLDYDGVAPLHWATIRQNVEIVKILFLNGANINVRGYGDWTPLHCAALVGSREMMEILIENDADLLIANNEREMPFEMCKDKDDREFIKAEMAKQGITKKEIQEKRNKPEQKMLADMKELVQQGQILNIRNPINRTTYLHIAASNGYKSVVKYLFEAGISINAKDIDGNTALDLAEAFRYQKIVNLVQLFMRQSKKSNKKRKFR